MPRLRRASRESWLVVSLGCAVLFGLASTARAQEQGAQAGERLLPMESDTRFVIAPETKFTVLDGAFANFTGLSLGWILQERILLGVAGYGLANGLGDRTMGYGGLAVEYFHRPSRMTRLSFGALVGGGSGGRSLSIDQPTVLVAEPVMRLRLNATSRMRIGIGIGYRLVGGGPTDVQLGGPSGSFQVSF